MVNGKRESPAGGAIGDLERTAAWKYVGYPGFSRFMASSNDCFALRKFTSLNVRTLLKLQNNVVELERRLDEMDNFSMNLPPDEGGCASFRLDANSPREELLDEIEAALDKYNSRLVNFLQIHERPVPSLEQSRNIQTWLANFPNAIENPEQEFILHEKDLFAVQLARRTHFGKWMESIGLYNIAGFRGAGSTAAASGKYYDRNAWKSLGGFWLMVCLLAMLLGPMWALPFAFDRAVRLSVVTAFAVAFSMIVIVGTTFKASHRGALVAGYFMQLVLVLGISPAWQIKGDFVSSSASSYTTVTSTVTTSPSTSILTRASTVTITATPSTSSTSSPTNTAQVPNSYGLSAGAVAGITVAVIIACIGLFLMFFIWYRRRRRRAHVRDPMMSMNDAPAYDARDTNNMKKLHEMAQPPPTVYLEPVDEELVASSSTQPVSQLIGMPRPRMTQDTDTTLFDAGITLEGGPASAASGKGKGRLLDLETPLSGATAVGNSSASPATNSSWPKRWGAAESSGLLHGTTLYSGSVNEHT